MANFIAQPAFSVAARSIAQLAAMPSTIDGEQFPINHKAVDKLIDALQPENAVLIMPIEVSVFGQLEVISGGRHRLEALKVLHENSDMVNVILVQCNTTQEVADRIVHNNGSRRCTEAEKKAITTAAKYGFGSIDCDALKSLLYGNDGKALNDLTVTEQLATVTSIIAMNLRNEFQLDVNLEPTLTVDTAEKLASSIVTQLKKMTHQVEHVTEIPTTTNKQGEIVDGGIVTTYSKVKVLTSVLSSSESLDYVIDSLLAVMTRATTRGLAVSTTIYDKAAASVDGKTCLGYSELLTGDGVTRYQAIIKLADNVQRGAAKYASLISGALQTEIATLF